MKMNQTIRSKYSVLVVIDFFMMILLIVNLSLILFDWLYSIVMVKEFLEVQFPDFYAFYQHAIHENFNAIDLVFVTIFLTEFALSWILASIQKVYYRWFFYPFFHWYDIIGCIPIGSLRFLRVLRVFSILLRLHNLGLIDLGKTYVYIKLKKYYDIVVEEISDRVVVNILEGIQDELAGPGNLMENIVKGVIRPNQEIITSWIAGKLERALEKEVLPKKPEIQQYVQTLIATSLANSSEFNAISQVPVMGKKITGAVETAISNVINSIIETVLHDLASNKSRFLVNEATNIVLDTIEDKEVDTTLDQIFSEIVFQLLEVVKKQVMVKKWQLKEKLEDGADNDEVAGIEFLLTQRTT